MKYIDRMQKNLDSVKEQNLLTAHQRVKAMLPLLEGEYMIKLAKNNPWYMGCADSNQYLGYLTFFVGIEMSCRREAARFKKEELPEVIKRLYNLKYLKLVKI
jgi:hypothetical protein